MRKTFNRYENLRQSLKLDELNNKKVHRRIFRKRLLTLVFKKAKEEKEWINTIKLAIAFLLRITSKR